jgi:regulatory protein
MEEYNYVNDAAYADNFVRSRHTTHRKGASAIRYELIRKGVDSETIAAAMEQVDPDSERANAVVLVEKKLRSTQHLERRKRTNRLVSMLARKGYSPGVAYEVVREVLDAEGADSDDTDD